MAAGGTLIEVDMIREFINIYRLYRWHGRVYAAKTAWRIAVQGIPF